KGGFFMNVCGIVCEYDPFHSGHKLHIEKTREELGEDAFFICCMSGNYTQRGEPALLPKHLRAAAALKCGADLVIELPSAYSLLSAEGFAFSGIYILLSTGILTDLSFGAETDDLRALQHAASLLSEHELAQKTLLNMKTGISYAAARERALYDEIKTNASVISSPNNILAIEYLKALLKLHSSVHPHVIKREGAAHGSFETSNGAASATAIRALARSGKYEEARAFMPSDSFDYLKFAFDDACAMYDLSLLDKLIYTQLLRYSPEDFRAFPDVSEGLEYRLVNAIHTCSDAGSAAFSAKTKRYPLSRIKRVMLRCFLGLTGDLSSALPPYIRVLGFNDRGKELLSLMRDTSELPVITKSAHVNKLSDRTKTLFRAESLATDLYFSAMPSYKKTAPGAEWRTSPVYIR
ncbi:MAG: nucleotidyltransferase family protein, partial [Clostridia bacterium]|nr:nucleotidyltransferase family protein [Clostridia bacterium]